MHWVSIFPLTSVKPPKMGLFGSLKGKLDVGVDDPTKQPIRDTSSHDGWSTAQEKRRLFGRGDNPRSLTTDEQYTPPSGPPPPHRAQGKTAEEFAPPAGPPPSHSKKKYDETRAVSSPRIAI